MRYRRFSAITKAIENGYSFNRTAIAANEEEFKEIIDVGESLVWNDRRFKPTIFLEDKVNMGINHGTNMVLVNKDKCKVFTKFTSRMCIAYLWDTMSKKVYIFSKVYPSRKKGKI